MPAQSKSSLKVFLRQPQREEPVLVWQLIGNHGAKWSAAQVAWSGGKEVQVRTKPFDISWYKHREIRRLFSVSRPVSHCVVT